MLAHRYKIWDWGNQIDSGSADSVKFYAGIQVVAKRHLFEPYEPFNELVCMHLGRLVGLPVPVGLIIERVANEPYYCSGDITFAGGEFPPADLDDLFEKHPSIACGIAVFDAWVWNSDRHAENVFYDKDEQLIRLIDHGRAVLQSFGISDLRPRADELSLHESFTQRLRNFESFRHWCAAIGSIPEAVIKDTLRDAAAVGVAVDEAAEAANLLIKRRRMLPRLFQENEQMFPLRERSLFSPFESGDSNDPIDYAI